MGRELIHQRQVRRSLTFPTISYDFVVLSGISQPFDRLSRTEGQITHVLLTRPPLEYLPKEAFPYDLHVLGTPPAFVLSQDQTLQFKPVSNALSVLCPKYTFIDFGVILKEPRFLRAQIRLLFSCQRALCFRLSVFAESLITLSQFVRPSQGFVSRPLSRPLPGRQQKRRRRGCPILNAEAEHRCRVPIA